MGPRIHRTILPVRELEPAVAFWSRVLDSAGERVSPGRHYFPLGDAVLALYSPEADGDDLGRGWLHHENQYLYLAVPDLEDTLERVRGAGGTLLEPIASMPWGERLFYALDPAGNPVSFVDETTLFRGDA